MPPNDEPMFNKDTTTTPTKPTYCSYCSKLAAFRLFIEHYGSQREVVMCSTHFTRRLQKYSNPNTPTTFSIRKVEQPE